MNIVFGHAEPASAEPAGNGFSGTIEKLFGSPPVIQQSGGAGASQTLGILSDAGAIIGRASDGDVTLAFIGAICLPLEGWDADVSPIDDASATARFLLDGYLAEGPTILDRINGQYAIAIADSKRGSTLLASDPYGGRSWFVREHGGTLAFSSHLLTLADAAGSELEIDRSLEDFFLIYGFYPFGRTPYAGIRALPPGCRLQWTAAGATTDRIGAANPWAAGDSTADSAQTEDEVIEDLYRAMIRATREQLPARKQRVAVLLGGFDSALVASLIHRLGYEVETYSFHYQADDYNQPHTDTLSEFLGIRHHWVEIDRHMLADGLREFPQTFSQPTNWPNYVLQTALVCERIRGDGITHIYSGDGCDAVFLGYPGTYLRARLFAGLPRLPRWLHRALIAVAARPLLDRRLGHPYRVALNILRSLKLAMPARGYLSFRIMDEISLRQLRRGQSPSAEKPIEALVNELSAPFASLPSLRLAYQGKAAVSPNRNKLIGSSDRAGVTILAPYMHPGLKNFAISLPETLMRPRRNSKSRITGKYILMRMAEEKGLLPPSIIFQKKVAAVDAPVDAWYDGPLRQTMLDIYKNLPFEYDVAYVSRLLDTKFSETLYKRFVMTDKVISHAASLLATYATFTARAGQISDGSSSSRACDSETAGGRA